MANKKTLEELAYEFVVLRHKNDKSGSQLARMNRRFGRKAADEAIANARKVLALVDPDNPRAKEPEKKPSKPFAWPDLSKGIQGRSAHLSIIDDLVDLDTKAFRDLYLNHFPKIRDTLAQQTEDALLYGTGIMPRPDKPAYGGFDPGSIRKDISWPIPLKSFQPEKTTSSSSALTFLASTEQELPDMPTSTEEPSGTKE